MAFLALLWRGYAADAPARIAILPVGTNEQVKALADILTSELTPDSRFQLFERAQVDKALAEQVLAAGGLSSGSNRVAIGRALQANGLCFVQKDPRRDRILVSLTETRYGFQVASFPYPTEDTKLADLAAAAHTDLAKALPKLRLDPSRHKLVSILRVGNATLSPDYFWIEDDLPQALGQFLASDPRILVLERRQLTSLLEEQGISAEAIVAFKAAGLIVDGELALTTGKPFESKAVPVTFTVRLLGPDLRQVDEVRETGTLDKLNALTAVVAGKTLHRILQADATATNATTAAEATLFLEMAQKQGLLWAAETARALDTSDTDALRALVRQLTTEGLRNTDLSTPKEQVLEQARKVRRATDLCLASSDREARKAFLLGGGCRHRNDLLSAAESCETEEIRQLLAPARQLAREEEEAAHFPSSPESVLWACGGFFDNMPERLSYVRALVVRMVNDTSAPRMYCHAHLHELMNSLLGMPPFFSMDRDIPNRDKMLQTLYSDLAAMTNPVVQFYAYAALANLTPDKKSHYQRMALDIGAKVAPDTNNMVTTRAGETYYHFPGLSAYRQMMLARSKDPYETLSAFLNPGMKNAPESPDELLAFARTECFGQLKTEDRIVVYDQLLAMPKVQSAPDIREAIEQKRSSLMLSSSPSPARTPVGAESGNLPVVFSSGMKAFRDIVASAVSEWAYDHASRPPDMSPFALNVDSNMLWIALFGSKERRLAVAAVGIDIQTSGLRACHLFFAEGVDNQPPCAVDRTRDLFLVAVPGAGLVHFPRKAGNTLSIDGKQGILNQQSGLVDLNFVDMIAADDNVYLAGPQSVICWNPRAGSCEVLLNLRERALTREADPQKTIIGILTDSAENNLFAVMAKQVPTRCEHRIDVLRRSFPSSPWAAAITNILMPCMADKAWTNVPATSPMTQGWRPTKGQYRMISTVLRPGLQPDTSVVVASFDADSVTWTNAYGSGLPPTIMHRDPLRRMESAGGFPVFTITRNGAVVRSLAQPP